MNSHLTYLFLDILSVIFPFLLSFDKKVAFYKTWKYLFPAMFIVGLFFIVWDMLFTAKGVWGFNPAYISGIHIFNLPIEGDISVSAYVASENSSGDKLNGTGVFTNRSSGLSFKVYAPPYSVIGLVFDKAAIINKIESKAISFHG